MRITIDTKEDSAQEIQHIIGLLQQILARSQYAPHPIPASPQYDCRQPHQASSPASSPMAMFDTSSQTQSAPAQPAMPMLSIFDAAPYQPQSSSSPLSGSSSMSSAPSMAMHASQERQQGQSQSSSPTPSIFDIFGSSSDQPAKSTTTQETANDLLNYDKEHDDDSGDSSYTFTTY